MTPYGRGSVESAYYRAATATEAVFTAPEQYWLMKIHSSGLKSIASDDWTGYSCYLEHRS
jgi:hypothetical protein